MLLSTSGTSSRGRGAVQLDNALAGLNQTHHHALVELPRRGDPICREPHNKQSLLQLVGAICEKRREMN